MSNKAESSNKSGRFNHLKNLKAYRDEQHSFDDPSFGDSGYTSLRQSTFNSTEHGSIRQSTSIMKTIDEERAEQVKTPTGKPGQSMSSGKKQSAIATPTTQSIQKMLKLRLETPEGQSTMEISPVIKEHTEEVLNPTTPPELLLSLRGKNTGNSTPKKSKLYGRKRSFRDNIDIENDYEEKRFCSNQMKEDKDEKLAKRIPISPINKQNRRVLRERSISDNNLVLRSSTPKSLLFRQFTNPVNTGAVPKQMVSPSKTPKKAKQTLRRYQSFSPGKLAQKYKAESQGKKNLLQLVGPSTSHESKETLTNIPEESEEKVPAICRQNALDISDFDTRECPINKTNSIQIEDLSGFNESAFSTSRVDCKSISPIKKCPIFEKLFQAPIIGDECDQSIDFISMSKSFHETSSYHASNSVQAERPSTSRIVEISPTKSEIRQLLYRDLPKTPLKDDLSLKRTKSKTPVKKLLFTKRTQYYDGMEKIDFFTRLQCEGVIHLIEEIYKYLSDEDVINSCLVSPKWKHAIDDCRSLNNRRLNYITSKKMPNKENFSLKKQKPTKEEVENPYRKVFSVHNYDTRAMMRKKQFIQHSPPASPDTTKFKENQKVVRRLSPRAMTTCPRCAKPSPIITQKRSDCIVKIGRSTRSSAKKSAELRKTVSDSSTRLYRSTFSRSPVFNFDDSNSSSSSSGSDRKIRRSLFPSTRSTTQPYDISKRNSLNSSLNSSTSVRSSFGTSKSCFDLSDTTNESFEEYAMCTGKLCGFKFCIRCQCEYHSNHMCRLSMELMSPGREEDASRNVSNRIGSRQSKRTLKRL